MNFDFNSTDVADALVELGIHGHVPNIKLMSPASSQTRLFGKVFTVKIVDKSEAAEQEVKGHFVDSLLPGRIALISAPLEAPNAVWGGLLTTRAKYIGVEGVVIDGMCRDLLEIQDAQFPLFARGTSVYGAGGFTKVSALNVPIKIGNVMVECNDYVVADVDGVVFIPEKLLETVSRICHENQKRDEKCFKDLKAGRSLTETFNEHRKPKK